MQISAMSHSARAHRGMRACTSTLRGSMQYTMASCAALYVTKPCCTKDINTFCTWGVRNSPATTPARGEAGCGAPTAAACSCGRAGSRQPAITPCRTARAFSEASPNCRRSSARASRCCGPWLDMIFAINLLFGVGQPRWMTKTKMRSLMATSRTTPAKRAAPFHPSDR